MDPVALTHASEESSICSSCKGEIQILMTRRIKDSKSKIQGPPVRDPVGDCSTGFILTGGRRRRRRRIIAEN
jgi:hypothetical protein